MKRFISALLLALIAFTAIGGLPSYAESQDAAYYTWENIDEFIDWYHSENFTMLWSIGDRPATCVDYALMVQKRAMQQGKLVSVAAVGGSRAYYDAPVNEQYHTGNLVITANGMYYIEPQPDKFRVIRLASLK